MGVLRFLSLLSLTGMAFSSVADAADLDKTVNYHRDVSRLMQKHCVQCHHEEGVAPFSLETFDDVEANAPMIQEVISRGTMPPWFAAPEADGKKSPWANDRTLPQEDKDLLAAWIKGGRTEGDAKDAPEPLEFRDGWHIEPDSIYTARKVQVKATGVMDYVYLTIDTGETRDHWVDAIEIRPSAPSTVHHVLAFVVPPNGDTSEIDGVDYWGVYAPGSGPQTYPAGYARRLPKGSKLVLSMHYTPNGVAAVDQTEIGVHFAEKSPKFEVRTASVMDTDFAIPPGAKDYKVTAEVRLPRDVRVLGFLPHSHLRGMAARYEVVSRSGESEILLDVPGYDFNWQLFYQYARPKTLRRGSTIKYTAWYDNSEDNPANPDPTQTVYWGEQTADEMHLGYVEFVIPRNRRLR